MFSKLKFQVRIYPCLLTAMLFGCQQQLQPNLQQQRATQGMAVSAHPLASDAGLMVLRSGGNAVDAAAATALAISVVEPFSAGIGGGGFLLLRRHRESRICLVWWVGMQMRSPLGRLLYPA